MKTPSPWRYLCLTVSVVSLLSAQGLSAQEPLEISIGGRLQTQLNTTSVEGEAPSQLFFRRARIELGVEINDWISGVIQPDFAPSGVSLKDAYLRLAFSPAAQLLVGQAYRPFGLLEQTSSKRILPVERGLRIRGLDADDGYSFASGLGYSNRDIGIQVVGSPEDAPLGLAYAAGVLRGPLHGTVGDEESYQVAARVTVEPVEDVRVGAGWSSRDFARPGIGGAQLERGNAFEVDLEVGAFAPGPHLLAELVRGELDPFAGSTFLGAQAWLAWRTGELSDRVHALEPLFRVSWSDTDGADAGDPAGGMLLTPGVNLYFGPINRIMMNYDVWMGEGDAENARSFKAMFQLGF